MIIDKASVGRTIDGANDALAEGRPIADDEKAKVASWLLGRQVTAGRNIGAFEPTTTDLRDGAHLYTGERLRTKLATRNVLSAEAARLLVLFGHDDPAMREGVERAESWLSVACFVRDDCAIGECAHSFVSHMRFTSVLEPGSPSLVRRVGVIRDHRDGKGRWERFPFYYTVLLLTELIGEAARSELRYAVPACERALTKGAQNKAYQARRRVLLERVIALDDLRLL